jgi:hypothetical protein
MHDRVMQHILSYWKRADGKRTGSVTTKGWLKSQGIPCSRDQVRRVLRQLDPAAVDAQAVQTIQRREYHVPFPNSMWHIDGHHKLFRWRMFIHGGIDGYSRLITYLGAADNNRAETVTDLFLGAVKEWGYPQRVRADFGGEDLGVKTEMEYRRGLFASEKSTWRLTLDSVRYQSSAFYPREVDKKPKNRTVVEKCAQ